MSPENIDQTLKDEQPYFQHHPKTTDSLAINGSKTKQDGLVKASATPRKIGGLSVVLVGENVIYTELFTPSNNQPIRNLSLPHIIQYLRKTIKPKYISGLFIDSLLSTVIPSKE